MEEQTTDVQNPIPPNNPLNQSQIAGAIIVAGLVIAGAIILKGGSAPEAQIPVPDNVDNSLLAPVTAEDYMMGNANAKVVLIEYADFQCPFCGRFFTDTEGVLREKYINTGKIKFVYRDFAFLGPESIGAAEAARCAGEQGKFWEYHDYLYTHQNGENRGAFADANLKSFAQILDLNTSAFSQCLDSGKYTKAVNDSTAAGKAARVNGTPKGFILKNGEIVSTIDGARPTAEVTAKLDAALK
ncbi:hypothetical protein A3I95_01195 [Candidatus Nomurabacteria bacterium RIFCSPLOWO2_02_FULL_44_12]|uniref:Thioredoxin domain-containing protein n=1 Tax=Candidatus Nomurabacteria bacterium RIFCSPLOWO2_12_FULL_44_11 TaxID=1801796 RepID=A0A1F6Y623_9BACT|nr:MAG: hypothetical protein A3E95_02940 [Candidatus Nomurabacteria bacterium RIFCSPHIGHO2_12_FULL_44_22b]OGJ01808.1 MAG: hypothetical protein A3G53_01760 [Candidatus Nomurabacteria bacterium RIFCSPLOWO2_12_FULL_44_11]OGJ07739.1 MAG: hypothetical protein A3I95_01195 [Candidatus Nomurabacteria bacterium RIFCSPLOWO2_02_FULL_44_12]